MATRSYRIGNQKLQDRQPNLRGKAQKNRGQREYKIVSESDEYFGVNLEGRQEMWAGGFVQNGASRQRTPYISRTMHGELK